MLSFLLFQIHKFVLKVFDTSVYNLKISSKFEEHIEQSEITWSLTNQICMLQG